VLRHIGASSRGTQPTLVCMALFVQCRIYS
jgi:hypothetical protein